MYVKNLASGEIETLKHGPATDAVNAGTHEFVNLDENGQEKGGAGKAKAKADEADAGKAKGKK